MSKKIKILWDDNAKSDLKIIYDFLKIKSVHSAKKVIADILHQAKSIHFSEQYQVDEILGEPYRRMIVRNYKIIYKVQSESEIRILMIFDSRQNPMKMKK